MKTIPIEEKIEIIKEVIEMLSNDEHDFICIALSFILARDYEEIFTDVDVFEYFPELLKYKPEGTEPDESWWSYGDTKSRIRVLNKLLEEYTLIVYETYFK